MEKKNLPSLQDLYKGDLEVVQAENKLNLLLNQNTNPKWIKTHPFAKDVKYLSIARIEFLLTSIFINWQVEIRNVQMIANSVVTTIRLHYQDPVTNEMRWQDGVGAAPIQTDKDAGAADFNKVKNDAVMKAAPASETFAVKDAAHKLGNIFGKDLNRRDEIVYDGLANRFDPTAKLKKILSEKIGECQDPEVNGEVMDAVLKAEEDGANDVEFYTELLKKHFDYEATN